MSYEPPIADILFTLTRIATAPGAEPPMAEADLAAIVEEAGRFAARRVAPLDRVSDTIGASWNPQGTWSPQGVKTPPGFREVYADWTAAGWNGLAQPESFGGAGLPTALGAAAMEMLTSGCMAFATLPVLNQGAADALRAHASAELQARYLRKIVSGEWAATMNLTEPRAGSDVGLVQTRAVPAGEGAYRLKGQKIFITFGDHDLTPNIIHLVLARLPDAPAGVKGISLFLVPKHLVAADGSLGPANDLRCAGIEHKLGIRGSPTCTMVYGDGEGALGWLVGEPHRGLACMFTMMNKARLATGLQGVAMAEKATQKALAYARERRQGRAAGFEAPAPIAAHPDVARVLARMRALTAATRALAYLAAAAIDTAERADEASTRASAEARAGLLTPVVKAFGSDIGCEVAMLGIQIHGGMGYVEETGAAQLLRDAAIAPIYEGTNAIQAIDLVTRKIGRDGGGDLESLLADCRAWLAAGAGRIGPSAAPLAEAIEAWRQASAHLLSEVSDDARLLNASAYLRLFGVAVGGALLARGAAADDAEGQWPRLARVYAEDIAVDARALLARVLSPNRRIADYRALAGLA